MARKVAPVVIPFAELELLKKSGLTVGQICEKIGVGRATWYDWRTRSGGITTNSSLAVIRAVRQFQRVMKNSGEPLDYDTMADLPLKDARPPRCAAITKEGERCSSKALPPYELCGRHLSVVYKGGEILTIMGERITSGMFDIHPRIKTRRCASTTRKGGRCRANAGDYNILCTIHERALDQVGRIAVFVGSELITIEKGEDYTDEET